MVSFSKIISEKNSKQSFLKDSEKTSLLPLRLSLSFNFFFGGGRYFKFSMNKHIPEHEQGAWLVNKMVSRL